MVFCSFVVHLHFLMVPLAGGVEEIWCENDHSPAGWHQPMCVIQGLVFHFFGLASYMWWCCVLIHMFYVVARSRKLTSDFSFLYKYFLCFSYGIPTVGCIIALANKKYLYVGGVMCFIDDSNDGLWQYALFFGWLYLSLIIGICVAATTIWSMRVGRMKNALGRNAVDAFTAKMIVVWVIVLGAMVCMSALRVDGTVNQDGYIPDSERADLGPSGQQWYVCIYTEYATQPNPDFSKCTFSVRRSPGIVAAAPCYLSLMGALIAVALTLNYEKWIKFGVEKGRSFSTQVSGKSLSKRHSQSASLSNFQKDKSPPPPTASYGDGHIEMAQP